MASIREQEKKNSNKKKINNPSRISSIQKYHQHQPYKCNKKEDRQHHPDKCNKKILKKNNQQPQPYKCNNNIKKKTINNTSHISAIKKPSTIPGV